MEQLGSDWTDFHEIWYLRSFRKSVQKIEVSLRSDKNKGHFKWRPIHIFFPYLAHFFLQWEMFQTKVVEKNKTHVLCSIFVFRKSFRLWDNLETYCTAVQATWLYGACALHAGYLRPQIHTPSGGVTLFVFPLQQWLHGRASLLRYTYTACLVKVSFWRCLTAFIWCRRTHFAILTPSSVPLSRTFLVLLLTLH